MLSILPGKLPFQSLTMALPYLVPGRKATSQLLNNPRFVTHLVTRELFRYGKGQMYKENISFDEAGNKIRNRDLLITNICGATSWR